MLQVYTIKQNYHTLKVYKVTLHHKHALNSHENHITINEQHTVGKITFRRVESMYNARGQQTTIIYSV